MPCPPTRSAPSSCCTAVETRAFGRPSCSAACVKLLSSATRTNICRLSSRFIEAGRTAEYMKTTLGWSLLLLVVFGVLTVRYVSARREGRLDRGIDPAFLLEPHEKAPDISPREPEPDEQPQVESATAKT